MSREFLVSLTLIVLTFFFFLAQMDQVGVDPLTDQAIVLARKNALLAAENDRLDAEVRDLRTAQGVIRLAREKHRLVMPGEIIIRNATRETVEVNTPRSSARN